MNFEIVFMAIQSLYANKVRALLSMLGIIIGVSTVIVVVGIGLGAQAKIEEQFKNLSVDSIMVMAGRGAGNFRFESEDSDYLVENGEFIRDATAMVRGNETVSLGKESQSYTVLGVKENFLDLSNLHLDIGDGISATDNSNKARVAVIGQQVVEDLFAGVTEDALGSSISIGNKKVKVVGILKENGAAGFISYDESVYVPFSLAKKSLFGSRAAVILTVLASDVDVLELALQETETLLRNKYKIKDGKETPFRLMDAGNMVASAQDSSETMTFLLTAVSAIVLIVSGIGIMNVMFVTVAERTKEIGILKAIGAKQKDILIQFLLEAVILSVLGGIFGIILGNGIIPLLRETYDTTFSISAVILGFSFSVLVGIFFGFYPAIKASQLDPVDALRSE